MGLESSCPVSRVVMDFWADEVTKVEQKMEVLTRINPVQYEALVTYLLAKYVDYVLTALEEMKRGTRWSRELQIMVWTTEAEMEDKDRNPEQVTMQAFADMASSIMDCLNFTWDAPSLNSNGMMPVLDTMVWVGTPMRTWGVPDPILPKGTSLPAKPGTLRPVLLYKFYRKPMANNTPMHSRSAASLKDQV